MIAWRKKQRQQLHKDYILICHDLGIKTCYTPTMANQNKKLRFSIISCGGTILMAPNERGILEPTKTINDVLNEINLSALKEHVNVVIERRLEIFKLDRSNLNPEHWIKIIEAIETVQEECDGIVIF